MFKLLPLVLAIPLSITSVLAAAGAGGGNGGGGIVCIQESGKRSVKLLDLREAEKNPDLTIKRSSAPWREQLEDALLKYAEVQPSLVELIRSELAYMEKNTILMKDRRLPPPTDTQISELDEPRNCFLEGVSDYNDNKVKLYLDPELDALMPETDRAALRFHEAWYRVQRSKLTPTANSKVARLVTGMVFAQEPLETSHELEGADQAIAECSSEDNNYSFFITPKGNDGSEILFSKIAGLKSFERTAITINGEKNKDVQIVEGKAIESLKAGYLPKVRPLTKKEKVNGRAGIYPVNGSDLFFKVKTKYGAPMKILISSMDLGSNEPREAMEDFVKNGFKDGWAFSWGLPFKKGKTHEHFSNRIALYQGNNQIFKGSSYAKDYNTRFSCKNLK